MRNPNLSSTNFFIHQKAIFMFETHRSAGNKNLSNPNLNSSLKCTQETYMKLYFWQAESAFLRWELLLPAKVRPACTYVQFQFGRSSPIFGSKSEGVRFGRPVPHEKLYGGCQYQVYIRHHWSSTDHSHEGDKQ